MYVNVQEPPKNKMCALFRGTGNSQQMSMDYMESDEMIHEAEQISPL